MCLSIPVKILEVRNKKAIVILGSDRKELGIDLVPEIKKDDYCLISNGFIIKKISSKEAEEIFKILKEGNL
ncbi:MAG: HypC/HybG/HupF family hydrogenase formation chaperone [Nanoarchaeota archaeon]|nr:HypC/HybG/HupF family hydrogenase formation chaperone [Nanoarchaeota archaeon]